MFNFFKGFFGPSDSTAEAKNFQREDFLRSDSDNDFFSRSDEEMGFNVFTNPLEMHRYFESQVNNLLKSFGIPNDSIFGFSDSIADPSSIFPEGSQRQPSNEADLRDQYLKPGFQNPHSRIQDRTDNDLDGKINPADLDSIFTDSKRELRPYEKPKMHTFEQIISKSFNGAIESHKTMRDNQGNEETVITYKRGDQEYTKTTKVDKDGKKKIHENFVNMSEKDLENFVENKITLPIEVFPENNNIKHPNWFPFDKYFK